MRTKVKIGADFWADSYVQRLSAIEKLILRCAIDNPDAKSWRIVEATRVHEDAVTQALIKFSAAGIV